MRRKLSAVLIIGGLVLAFATTAGAVPAASALGQPNKATGTPVTLGLISDGKSDTVDNTPEIKAAQAAVNYINNYKGGLAGHPIKLEVCETKQTPTGATNCATQMVDAKVAAILTPVSGQMSSIYDGIQGSGIPFIAGASNDQNVLLKPGAFVLQNGLGFALAGPAGVARDNGVKNAAVLVADVPAASGPVQSVGGVFYKNAGVTLDVVPVPLGTADMTPQVQAALAKGPGQFSLIGDPSFCTSALKALKTLGYDKGIVVIPQCIDESSAKAVPGGLKGITEVTAISNSPKTADYKTYSAAMDKYAKGTSKGGVATGGWSTVLGAVESLQGITGDVTPETITAALKAMPPTALPLGGGIMVQCNSPISIVPNICSTQVLVAQLDKAGVVAKAKVLETKDLIKLG